MQIEPAMTSTPIRMPDADARALLTPISAQGLAFLDGPSVFAAACT